MIETFLPPFADVRRGEGTTAILLALNLFVLLTAYLVIKTVREPLILAGGGAEMKSYAAAGQALLLLLVVPAYGALGSRVSRIKLVNWVTIFFISNLVLFYVLARFEVPLGVVFFLWVGIFNLFAVAQFWSFANDIYTRDQGERLFAIVAFGGSLGAIVGPLIAGWLFRPLGAYQLMLVAAALLAVCVLLSNIVNTRQERLPKNGAKTADAEKPLGKDGGFRLVVGQRYLSLIALLMVLVNLVNTTGEFILGRHVTDEAREEVVKKDQEAALVNGDKVSNAQKEKLAQDFVGEFYADYFFWVSLLSAILQLSVVSRIFKYCGVSGALFFLPAIALSGYSLIALVPALSFIRVAKIFENSTDYSLQNTARQAMFLPTSREAKYKAKAAIDTFFVRVGDVLSAIVVFFGSRWLLGTETLATINIVLIITWLGLVAQIGRHYRKLSSAQANDTRIVPVV